MGFLLWLWKAKKDCGSEIVGEYHGTGISWKVSRPGEMESDLDIWTPFLQVHSEHLSEVLSLPAGRDLALLKRSSQNFQYCRF